MKRFVMTLTVLALLISIPAFAGQANKGLFVNLSTNEIGHATVAVTFAQNILKQGHPTTIMLNSKGAILANTRISHPKDSVTGRSVQDLLNTFMSSGGKVIISPLSMQKAGIRKGNLLPRVKIGNPQLLTKEIFGNVQVISW